MNLHFIFEFGQFVQRNGIFSFASRSYKRNRVFFVFWSDCSGVRKFHVDFSLKIISKLKSRRKKWKLKSKRKIAKLTLFKSTLSPLSGSSSFFLFTRTTVNPSAVTVADIFAKKTVPLFFRPNFFLNRN